MCWQIGKARIGEKMTQSYLIKLGLLRLSRPKYIHSKRRGLDEFDHCQLKTNSSSHCHPSNYSKYVDDGKWGNHLEKVKIRDQSDPFKCQKGISSAWCGSVDWALACDLKSHGFNSWSGTCLGCWLGPQLGVCEKQPVLLSHTDVFLPLFLLPFSSF